VAVPPPYRLPARLVCARVLELCISIASSSIDSEPCRTGQNLMLAPACALLIAPSTNAVGNRNTGNVSSPHSLSKHHMECPVHCIMAIAAWIPGLYRDSR
jgi:hypothetical protein